MFDKHPNDLARTLTEMDRIARDRCNANQIESKQKLKEFIAADRRFDGFDKEALASRVMLSRSNGATLDLGDPRLKGLPPRPLDPDRW
jgi:hypothetical protein